MDVEGESSQLPSFMKKPEVIKMHLDILYKSITFLSEEKIIAKIEMYRQAKEQKKREEEERIQMQIQIKKQRGRNTGHQQPGYVQMSRKDRKPQLSGEREGPYRADGTESNKTGVMTRHGLSSNSINQKGKDIMNSSERYEQANSINNTTDTK